MTSEARRRFLVAYDNGQLRDFRHQPEVRIIADHGRLVKVFYQEGLKDRWQSRTHPKTCFVKADHLADMRRERARKK